MPQTRLFVGALVACLAALTLTSCQGPDKAPANAGPPPIVPVSVAVAKQESVPVEIRAIGAVEASAVIQVKSQVAGELTKVHFTEGAHGQQGRSAVSRSTRNPIRLLYARLRRPQARDTALLQQAQANLGHDLAQAKTAESDARRYQATGQGRRGVQEPVRAVPIHLRRAASNPFGPTRPPSRAPALRWKATGRPSIGPSWT